MPMTPLTRPASRKVAAASRQILVAMALTVIAVHQPHNAEG
jgi:hypothetical protein